MAGISFDRITTYSLMTIVLFFSYIYDSLRNTYSTGLIVDKGFKKSVESPLAKMPTILRLYSYFSTLSHVLITSKYIILSIFKYHFIVDQNMVTCYLPGRVSFLDDLSYELPGLAIMMSGSHLVWRSMWYVIYRQLNLESLIFIVYDDEFVDRKRTELKKEFTSSNLARKEKVYNENRMFCQKIQTQQGKVEFRLRKDRDLNRKKKLNKMVRSVTVIMLMNTIFFGTPLVVVMVMNTLSHHFFDLNYKECRVFSRTTQLVGESEIGQHIWSFSDSYRMSMLFADAFDNFMILFDSASGLTWPLVTSTIVGLDLTISMDDILSRLKSLQQSLTSESNQRNQAEELEIIVLQSDIMIVFENVRKVDRYINAFAAYAIIFWVTINVTYEVLYVLRRQEYTLNSTVVWVQMAVLILLTFTFAHLGRTHTKTVQLYHTCCSLMAKDPFTHTTKRSWIWLLEYYNQHKSLYSLHMGWTVLTFTNYIKFMLYSITFSMVVINLLRHELD